MAGILDLVGNTPLVELKKLNPNKNVIIYGKLEGNNPGGSVKDRAAYGMIKGAIDRGEIKEGIKLIEATSGINNNFFFGRDPQDYQWATDFGIDAYGDGGGVYFGSIASIPRHYLTGLPGNWGFDWSYWRQNVWDFLCAGGNNFQTALDRSYRIQSFSSQPTPPDSMVWIGYGFFAF